MTERMFKFVPNSQVRDYARLGWRASDALNDTHHGEWSTLMEWMGEGEPVMPVVRTRQTQRSSDA